MMTVVQDKVSRRLLFLFAVLAAFAAAAQPAQSAEEEEEITPVVETLELKADTNIKAESLVDVEEDDGPVIILQWC